MSAGIVITAREESTRFPGKHLAQIGDRKLIEGLIQRLLPAEIPIVVALTPGSQETAGVIRALGVKVFMDKSIPDAEVTERVICAAEGMDPVIHVCGDSPFMAPELITSALREFESGGYDLLWNSGPSGFRWKVCKRKVLVASGTPREHVLACYTALGPVRFWAQTLSPVEVKFSVDTRADLEFAREIVARLGWSARAHEIIREGILISDHPDVREKDATGHTPLDSAPGGTA